jgi:N-acetylmuramic acid 6-phosphate etherase
MDHLLTEARNPASANLDALTSIEIVRLMNAEDASIASAVATQAEAIAQAIDVIAERFRRGGRLVYMGAGTSGRLGVLDASECPPTFNSPPSQVIGLIAGGYTALTSAVEGAEDHPEFADADLKAIAFSSDDVLVGIATSGRTPYVIGGLRYAQSVGAFAIGLACVPDSDLVAVSNLMIAPLVGPEVLTGSTRLKAGTATKLVLNMLTTGAMVRLGKTFGNLMVDLRATNEKLKARTNRIVRHLLRLDAPRADELLQHCNGELKTALVVGLRQVSPDEARVRLANASGCIADLLTDTRPGYPTHVIGIDGGGTHTVAMLGMLRDGKLTILGRGEGGPSNMKAVGEQRTFAEIDRAIAAAFANAALDQGTVGAACLGLAGAGRAEDQQRVRDRVCRMKLSDRAVVVGDVELPVALLPEKWGIIVVAGTGSCVWGRGPDGRTSRAGGWGPLLGDEGGAYSLVLEALKVVTRVADRRAPPSSLGQRLLAAMGLTDPSQLVATVHEGTWDRTRLAALATEVVRSADEGDAAAVALVESQIGSLADCVASVIDALALPREAIPIALTGGLMLNAMTYRERFLSALAGRGIRAKDVLSVSEPAEGAIRIALELLQSQKT